MCNYFKFNAVGHGLFYTGSIDDGRFNFVYDCGSKSETLIKNRVDALKCKNIDFVAISHFHSDHINGLYYLMTKHKVETVYLPYFDIRTYKNVFIANLIMGGVYPTSREYKILIYWYKIAAELVTVNGNIEKSFSIKREFVGKRDKKLETSINNWQFNFYNKSLEDWQYATLDAAIKKVIGADDIEEYLESHSDYDALKDAFSRVFYKINISSLVLLHWDKQNSLEKTLLSGDIEFDGELLKRINSDIDDNDRLIFQAPHHGAAVAWNTVDNSIKDKSTEIVVNCKDGDLNHPSSDLIVDLYSRKEISKLTIVNDKREFTYNR